MKESFEEPSGNSPSEITKSPKTEGNSDTPGVSVGPEQHPKPDALTEEKAAAAFDASLDEDRWDFKIPKQKSERPTIKRPQRPQKPEQPHAPQRPGPPSWWVATLKFIRTYTKPDTISGLAIQLFLIASVVALVLSVGNAVTGGLIEERETAARDEAMRKVIDADEFMSTGDKNIYLARLGGNTVGYAVMAAPNGYGGPIRLIVGVSPDFKVIGVSLLSMSETPGYGARMQTEPEFLEQFAGRSLPLAYGENGLDALSGATVTSDAVLNGIRNAVKYAIDYVTGGTGS